MLSADDLAEQIIARRPGLTSMQLQKLLYYVEGWHLAITDQPLFTDDQFRAWRDGPVLETVWRARKEYRTRLEAKVDMPKMPSSTEAIIELVVREYGGRTGDELSALTHTELPWLNARRGLPDDSPSRNIIPNYEIARFFRDHRKLAGRTSADLAAGGIYLQNFETKPRDIDLRALLSSLDEQAPPPDAVFRSNRSTGLDGTHFVGIGPRGRHDVEYGD